MLHECQQKHRDDNPYIEIYQYFKIEKLISDQIERKIENYNTVGTTLDQTNWQMAQFSAQLEEAMPTLQIELNR